MMVELAPRFTFENFVVGRQNELAHAAARQVAEEVCAGSSPSGQATPLYLYSEEGLGKTHLMQAMRRHIGEHAPGRTVIYISAGNLVRQFVEEADVRATESIRDSFRSADLVLVDNIQFVGEKQAAQEQFFRRVKERVEENRPVVIAADKSPFELQDFDERQRSLFAAGFPAEMYPPDSQLRLAILQAKVGQAGFQIQPTVLDFLAHKIASNVHGLESALNRIVAHRDRIGCEVTLAMAQEIVQDLVRMHERQVTVDEIQECAAGHFGIEKAEMTSSRRARIVARPRQVAMYLAKNLTPRSLSEIGRKFGGRDHTAVMHAIKKIEELTGSDRALREDVGLLRRRLSGAERSP